MESAPPIAIPPGQEELMARMFHRACRIPPGWRFEDAQAMRTHLRVRYRHADGDGVTLLLEHPGSAPGGGDAATAGFSIRLAEPRPARDCASLLAAVCASVATHEGAWRWCAPAADPADVELCALLAGVKPRIRLTVAVPDLDRTAARYRSAGVAVCELGRAVPVRGGEVGVLYAARARREAVELRDLESEFFAAQARSVGREEEHHYNARIGALLGYPGCCVEAFCGRARPIEGLADGFRAARSAWVPLPYARLNDTLLSVRRSLISFEPCAYDCAAARRIADRIAGAVEAVDSGALAELDSLLARAVLVHPSGVRAWIEIEAGAAPRIAAATAVPGELAGTADAGAAALVGELVGLPIESGGLVRPGSGPAAVAVDFAARSR